MFACLILFTEHASKMSDLICDQRTCLGEKKYVFVTANFSNDKNTTLTHVFFQRERHVFDSKDIFVSH